MRYESEATLTAVREHLDGPGLYDGLQRAIALGLLSEVEAKLIWRRARGEQPFEPEPVPKRVRCRACVCQDPGPEFAACCGGVDPSDPRAWLHT